MFHTNCLNWFFRAVARHPPDTLPLDTGDSAGAETIVDPVIPVLPQDFAIPQEIIYEILDRLASVPYSRTSLRSCSCVSKLWVAPSRRHLFHTVSFKFNDTFKWIQTFPVPDQSPAHHVRRLFLSLQGRSYVPEEFFKHIQRFTNVEELSMFAGKHSGESWWIPSFVRLPQTATSLTLNGDQVTILQIRDVMAQLPNLNNLSLSGPLLEVDGNDLQGIGTALKGKFGGRLQLRKLGRRSYADIVNMLFEVPTGLHFTEVNILDTRECLLLTVKLAEAFGSSLVKLSYSIHDHGYHKSVDRPFDFTRLPNLEVVMLNVHWTHGSLHWISTAISTLKPATSPHLHVVQLNFTDGTPPIPPRESGQLTRELEQLTNDLILIKNGANRIKLEFDGKVDVTMRQYMRHRPQIPL